MATCTCSTSDTESVFFRLAAPARLLRMKKHLVFRKHRKKHVRRNRKHSSVKKQNRNNMEKWHNWANTVGCQVLDTVRPESIKQLVEVAEEASRKGARVWPMGTSHSWNPAAYPCRFAEQAANTLVIDMTGLGHVPNDMTSTSKRARLVRVEAGTTLGELSLVLETNGLTLANYPTPRAATIAGLVLTASHGSGHTGSLAESVQSFTVLAPSAGGAGKERALDWEMRIIDRDQHPDEFRDLVVWNARETGMIVTELNLICEPALHLLVPVERLGLSFEDLVDSADKWWATDQFPSFVWHRDTEQFDWLAFASSSPHTGLKQQRGLTTRDALTREESDDYRLEAEYAVPVWRGEALGSALRRILPRVENILSSVNYTRRAHLLFRFVLPDLYNTASPTSVFRQPEARMFAWFVLGTPVPATEQDYLLLETVQTRAWQELRALPHLGKFIAKAVA